MAWGNVKLKEILKQVKNVIDVDDSTEYLQVTVSNTGEIKPRGIKAGAKIGTKKQTIIKEGWFIYSRLGIHQGAFGIVPEELNGAIVTGDMPVFRILETIVLPEFLIYSMRLQSFRKQLVNLTRGLAQTRIREKFLLDLEIKTPPVIEQQKILKKVKMLESLNTQVTKSNLLSQLQIQKLRQAILSEAIQGKLVPQDPNDEPASVLLERIESEKEKLIKERKIKKEKSLSPISQDEIPFEIPKSWKWVRLGMIGNACESSIVDGPFGSSINVKKDYIAEGVPVIRMMNIKPYKLILENIKYINKEKFIQLRRHNVLPGDVIFAKVGAGIGECCVVPVDFVEGMLATTGVCRFRVGAVVCALYLNHFLTSHRNQFVQKASTTAQPFLNMTTIKDTLLPLPPIKEQERIIGKVGDLMNLCDELEEQGKKDQANSEKLMDAILREAFVHEA